MGRPRAGHGWTIKELRGRPVWMMWSAAQRKWITTEKAKGWPGCSRCRKPEEPELVVNGLCNACFYFHSLTGAEFWGRKDDEYFPYNIGRVFMRYL